MMSGMTSVRFGVRATTQNGETVCVVGNLPELGSWIPQSVVPLQMQRKLQNGEEVWCRTLELPACSDIQYRYLKAHLGEPQHEEDKADVMISSWESHLKPRVVGPIGGQDDPAELPRYGFSAGVEKVDKGWLTSQTEVRLRLHTGAISMWKARHRQQTYRVKCTAIDLRHNDDDDDMSDSEMSFGTDDEESNHDLITLGGAHTVTVSVLRDDMITPHSQPLHGTTYKEDDYMVFHIQTLDIETMGYQFDIYTCHPNSDESDAGRHVGTSYLLPINLTDLHGVKTIPITGSKQKPIGQLKVDYLIIKPLLGDLCDMSVSYSQHWKQQRPVDVGHRGLGTTYGTGSSQNTHGSPRKCEAVKENTIASLSEAGGHGADFVEFDVQLSKDAVPVIYHDLVVGLSLKKRKCREMEWFEVPVSDLSLEQLHMLKVEHISTKAASHADCTEDSMDLSDMRPFPTLQQCLEKLDGHIGFNIEVKYCMPLKNGGNEEGLRSFMERNKYIDIILKEVLQYAGSRKIIFSAFDPDICTMIRLKQNRFPVLFLCNDVCEAWPAYLDARTWDVSVSAAYCASEKLLGVNPNTKDLLARPELVQQAKDLDLVVFCWGDDTNSKANIAKLKLLGVDGLIYDKIHELKTWNHENVFMVDEELLADIGKVPPSTNGGQDLQLVLVGRQERGPDYSSLPSTSISPSPSFAGKISSLKLTSDQ